MKHCENMVQIHNIALWDNEEEDIFESLKEKINDDETRDSYYNSLNIKGYYVTDLNTNNANKLFNDYGIFNYYSNTFGCYVVLDLNK